MATVRWSGAAALLLLTALVLLGLGWEWHWAPTGRGTLALKVLPLVPALPGLLRRRLYTYRWLSLLVWIYVAEGLVRGWSDRGPGQALAWVEVLVATALFVACAVQVRARLRLGKVLAA